MRVILGRAPRTVAPRRCAPRASGAGSSAAPAPREHERNDRLSGGGLDGDLGRDPDRRESLLEQDSGRGTGWADHERRPRELAGAERPIAMRDRPRGQHEQQLLFAERVGDQLSTGERQVRGAELASAVPDERPHAVGALGLVDSDLDAGVLFAEAPDQVRHRIDRERRQRGQLEPSRLQFDDPGDRLAGFVDGAEHLTSGTDERLPGRGHAQAAPDPMEQVRAELGLQRANGLRQGRLGDMQAPRRAGHAALVDDRDEVSEPAIIHRQLQCIESERRL